MKVYCTSAEHKLLRNLEELLLAHEVKLWILSPLIKLNKSMIR